MCFCLPPPPLPRGGVCPRFLGRDEGPRLVLLGSVPPAVVRQLAEETSQPRTQPELLPEPHGAPGYSRHNLHSFSSFPCVTVHVCVCACVFLEIVHEDVKMSSDGESDPPSSDGVQSPVKVRLRNKKISTEVRARARARGVR